LTEHLKRDWTSTVYAFYYPETIVGEAGGCKYHESGVGQNIVEENRFDVAWIKVI
jgi:hypothetical protein